MSGAGPVIPVLDTLGRPLRNLRLSVTDRCNLRCSYCMPEEEYVWLPREDILTFEEAAGLVDVFTDLGVDKVRLTGGEPLLRNGLERLVRLLAAHPRLRDLAITTNGILLAERASALRGAGLHRVTVSLDTLRPERFKALTRREALPQVLEGIASVGRAGFPAPKLDTVVMRGTNEDELGDLIEYARGVPAEIRFIEYMDVGGATRWTRERVVSRAEMLEVLSRRYGAIEPLNEGGSAPADRYRLPDGYVFGIIASTTAALLPGLRPEPPHRRRDVVPLPLRHPGHRSAEGAPRGRVTGRPPGPDPAGLDGAPGPRRRGAARHGGWPLAAHPDRGTEAGPPSGDAHQRRVTGLFAGAEDFFEEVGGARGGVGANLLFLLPQHHEEPVEALAEHIAVDVQ